ncbi:MAG: stage IV sporulation protein A, partial [Clostridia bacterium]|nr:stage IV sporulation protein A [Clostridia bacterium]
MLDYNVYEDVAKRSGGDIYIGVVGPVRTGKSTLIKKFMTELVIPNVTDANLKSVMVDELPQSATGRSVMTTEPKFVPAKSCEVKIENASANFRLIDCVGFITEGASGFEEDGKPRLVNTPWSDEPLPFTEAAALGTEKVIKEHSTIGILVTCDGSIADIPRQGYIEAEEHTVRRLKEIGKPFVIVLNCADPTTAAARALKAELEAKYSNTVIAANCERLDADGLLNILKAVLFEFPVLSFNVNVPDWMRFLPPDSTAVVELLDRVRSVAPSICKMKDCSAFDTLMLGCEYWKEEAAISLNLSEGKAEINASCKDGIFFDMLSEIAGDNIADEYSLMRYVRGTAEAKHSYDKIKDAFECARVNGYGIVQPDDSDMSLEQPKVVRQGGSVGIKLRATAPSYHIVKIDVTGEVSPIMGSASQSEGIVQGMMTGFETNPEGMWETNVFGKSLRGMVKEGLAGKVSCMHDDTKAKMRRAITRIINEGKGGVICIL